MKMLILLFTIVMTILYLIVRLLVINDQVGEDGRRAVESLAADKGLDIHKRLQQTEVICEARRGDNG